MAHWRAEALLSCLAFAGVFCLMLASGAAGSGTPTGTISGYILDPNGLAVPAARVMVVIPQMPATRSVSSNQRGAYSVPPLMPGLYNLKIEARGFETIYLDGVVMEAEQRARMDFALTMGSKLESIAVFGVPHC